MTIATFLAGMKVFGQDILKAFAWYGSPKGQQIAQAGEAVVEAVVPASVPIVNLFNAWAQKAYSVEALAVAAGQATGTGLQKAAIVSAAVAPDVLAYLQQAGVPARTDAQIAAANDAAIAFINAMTAPPAIAPAP